ncbi:MAG: 1,4-dihydroxy-2-naphthoate octaprenyltransferase [Chloroflexi bacterium]|nr:1,4-dihydroxy-2-naphthoate octaprenyltransferase [Chloroflexota bacterium]
MPLPADFLGRARFYGRAWYWAARPFTLSASVVPVFVGSALALHDGAASAVRFPLVLLGSLLVQVGTNLVDEYVDHRRTGGRGKLLAPYKVIAGGLLSERAVRLGALLVFGAAVAIGLALVALVGWPLLLLCLASLAAAYFYSAGPRPLGALALGELTVAVFMGPVMVLGTYYVHTGTLTGAAWLLSLPVACTVTAILVANDLRDLEEDRAAGKVTPIVLLGPGFGRWLWSGLVLAALLAVVALASAQVSAWWLLVALLAAPVAVRAARAVFTADSRPALGRALALTARFHLWFGALLSAGLLIAWATG